MFSASAKSTMITRQRQVAPEREIRGNLFEKTNHSLFVSFTYEVGKERVSTLHSLYNIFDVSHPFRLTQNSCMNETAVSFMKFSFSISVLNPLDY